MTSTFWVMGEAWLATHVWEHYLYTGDEEFLREHFDIMEQCVMFFRDFLIRTPEGTLVTSPSISPENTYEREDGTQGVLCESPTMDTEILTELFTDYISACHVLGMDEEKIQNAEKIMDALPPLKIGKHGQLMEWMEDYDEAQPGHRHISQLYALHPSHQITVDKTPELAEAASRTLERRLAHGGGHTGWSCAWIVNLYSRLGDGEKAYRNLQKLWSQSTFPNLMDTHPRKKRGGAA